MQSANSSKDAGQPNQQESAAQEQRREDFALRDLPDRGARNDRADQPNWVDKATLIVLMLTLAAAAYAGLESRRLAIDTEVAISDARGVAKANSADTAKLIKATADFASAMEKQAQSTESLAGSAGKSAQYAQQFANASTGQLSEMRAEQRPEIHVEYVENIAPLQSDSGVGTLFRLHLLNSGKSTALYTYPHGKFILHADNQVLAQQKAACAQPIKPQPGESTRGYNIAAGASVPLDVYLEMTPEETKHWKAAPTFRPMLVGCIDYMFGRDHHHTPFVYEIDRTDPSAIQGWRPIDPNTDKIDKGQLMFLVPPFFTVQPD